MDAERELHLRARPIARWAAWGLTVGLMLALGPTFLEWLGRPSDWNAENATVAVVMLGATLRCFEVATQKVVFTRDTVRVRSYFAWKMVHFFDPPIVARDIPFKFSNLMLTIPIYLIDASTGRIVASFDKVGIEEHQIDDVVDFYRIASEERLAA